MADPSVPLAAGFVAAVANTAPCIWRDRAEHLPDVASLARLLADHGLTSDGLSQADVMRARELRDALRAPFEADTDTACAEAVDDLLAQLSPVPRLEPAGDGWEIRLRSPSLRPIDDRLATAAYALAQLIATDGRRRLHRCAAEHCQGLFVDPTRNRSRRFCMPELCGNRTNVAAHRDRHRTTNP